MMRQKLENVLAEEYAAAGGVDRWPRSSTPPTAPTERNVLDTLAETTRSWPTRSAALLFVFEDILKLDDRAIQLVLREVDDEGPRARPARRARGGEGEDPGNMSQRGAEMLREEMEYMPPQRKRVVEEAQSRIVAAVRRLEDAGEIVIARGGEDEDELVV